MMTPTNIIFLIVTLVAVVSFIFISYDFFKTKVKQKLTVESIGKNLDARRAKNQIQFLLNTTTKKALFIHLANFAAIFLVLTLGEIKTPFKIGIPGFVFFYLIIGVAANTYFDVIPGTRFYQMNFTSRFEIRLFYAWVFPKYIYLSFKRKN